MKVTTDFLNVNELEDDFFDKFLGRVKNGYYNVPASFDIETTSTYDKGGKVAFMYVWQVNIDGFNIIGRTWEQFTNFIERLENGLCLTNKSRFVFYVHNLSYEFQFMRKHFQWKDTFFLDRRQPIRATTENNVEFRCSMILSGYKLETLARNLTLYKVKKQVGKLDYSKIHTCITPLTKDEISYCLYDVIIVSCYIDEYLQKGYTIENIPMTKTGFVRRYIQQKTDTKIYHKLVSNIQIKEDESRDIHEYLSLQRAFTGGYTHANVSKVGKVLSDIHSFDFTSSYPAVMLTELYPKSSAYMPKVESKEGFEYLNEHYLWIANIKFHNLESVAADDYFSQHRCRTIGAIVNNGRIKAASICETTITSVDFKIVKRAYQWDTMEIGEMYCYQMGYLPKEFILAIIELYQKKTTLKGVKDKEEEYLVSKGMLNSSYGMTVTDIVRDTYTYENDEFLVEMKVLEDEISKYNYKKKRFLAYQWGVFVTAYARYNLWTAILEMGNDYVYCDTDSIKFSQLEKHQAYFENYNQMLWKKVEKMCSHYGISPDLLRPKTIKGKEKPIGYWDYEGKYKRFKTLGAKRYLTENENNEFEITVAGLPKRNGAEYLLKHFPKNPFDGFKDGMTIPDSESGKLTPTYLDFEQEGVIKDYLGTVSYYHELSSLHLEKSSFTLSLAGIFKRLVAAYVSGLDWRVLL